MKAQFCLNKDEDGCIKLPSGLDGAIVPILFRVLQICTQKSSETGDLEDINAVLGSFILMPTQFNDDPGALNMKFHCINWYKLFCFLNTPNLFCYFFFKNMNMNFFCAGSGNL